MARRSALIHAAVGALIAEGFVWAILLPWAHHQYTTGIAVGLGLWRPIVLLALIGGGIGVAVFAVRQTISGRLRL